jgi:hypothetical protein
MLRGVEAICRLGAAAGLIKTHEALAVAGNGKQHASDDNKADDSNTQLAINSFSNYRRRTGNRKRARGEQHQYHLKEGG